MRIALFACLALLACKGDQEPPTQAAKPENRVPATAPTGAASPGVPTMKSATPPAPPPLAGAPANAGSCTLEASGAFTAKETTPGGSSATASKYWQSEEQRGAMAMPAITVNCNGKDLHLSIVSTPNASAPYGPKTYKVERHGELVLLGRAGKSLSDFTGTIDVTAFDGSHIAGTIAVTAKQIGGGNVKLDGSFDFKCPGLPGCTK